MFARISLTIRCIAKNSSFGVSGRCIVSLPSQHRNREPNYGRCHVNGLVWGWRRHRRYSTRSRRGRCVFETGLSRCGSWDLVCGSIVLALVRLRCVEYPVEHRVRCPCFACEFRSCWRCGCFSDVLESGSCRWYCRSFCSGTSKSRRCFCGPSHLFCWRGGLRRRFHRWERCFLGYW